MALLSVNGVDVRAASAPYDLRPWGDVERAFSGRMRSDIRGHHRIFRVTTAPISTLELDDLRVQLHGEQPVVASGDMIGTPDADCLVRAIRITPATADLWVMAFELHEVVT